MVNLSTTPFHLGTDDIQWVQDTLASMSTRQKIGQLFCTIGFTEDREQLKELLETMSPGGIMYRPGSASQLQEVHRFLQENADIPLLISANLEAGGNGIAMEGTNFAKPMQVAATDEEDMAYKLGLVCGREGRAVGCNWTFAPIVDIDYNYSNPITNVRTFGSDPQRVARMAKSYTRGVQESGMAVSVKHFPGDGVDDRDQHLLTSINDQSVEEWDASFGMVYKELIEAGADTIMVGHIMLPAYSRRLVPGIRDEELMPATLAPELVTGLLREQLGFNGLIVTDSTGMAGFTMAQRRELAVPQAIAAGCDMFLFNKSLQEDFRFMLQGYENGIVSPERLDEAVTRILALKASLGLHRQQREGTLVPAPEALSVLRCEEHVQWAKSCADRSVTLVKDTQQLLPLEARKHKRLLFYVLGDEGRRHTQPDIHKFMVDRLRAEGFEVTVFDKAAFSFDKMFGSVGEMKQRFDAALYFANIETASNQTTLRINWAPPMGIDMPWFTPELPALFISLANPYHLQDVPRIRTYVNAYTGNEYVVEAVVDKLLGKTPFTGQSPVNPYCSYWEARL